MRWNCIRDAVDSRTQEEIDGEIMPKSRYSGMNHYISDHKYFQRSELEAPIQTPVNSEYLESLEEAGVPNRLAQHFA